MAPHEPFWFVPGVSLRSQAFPFAMMMRSDVTRLDPWVENMTRWTDSCYACARWDPPGTPEILKVPIFLRQKLPEKGSLQPA
jgi:hypothetical protein